MGVVQPPSGERRVVGLEDDATQHRDRKEWAANVIILGLIAVVQLAWLAAFAYTFYRLAF